MKNQDKRRDVSGYWSVHSPLDAPKDMREPDRPPVPIELLRSRTLIRREATHVVYERYEAVGGMLLLMSVERVPW